ncbi:DUF7192 family protein [Butyrivibrio sp. AC2005]|uniref:DUF7192 family protein n=1 Tax=Butyrivibrio sp. AC2005 TaxID=1280672 RepID=UPI000409154B|nr:hypothetical protein [Butyrivibrio sp. AC2005]
MISTIKKMDLETGRYSVNAEIYDSCLEMLDDLKRRKITDRRFHNVREDKLDALWCGVKTYDQALGLLAEGFTPAVKKIYEEIRIKNGRKINGTNRSEVIMNSVVGYQPIVPLALYGVPNNMLIRKTEKIEARVFNIFIDTTCVESTMIQELIRYGILLIRMINNLEMCGHKINLYICEAFAGQASADLLFIKTKNSNSPLDLRRVSFPLCHTAFTRVICFDWYSKFPKGIYRDGYGTTLQGTLGRAASESIIKKIFGPSSVYITYAELKHGGEEYLKSVLGIDKVA